MLVKGDCAEDSCTLLIELLGLFWYDIRIYLWERRGLCEASEHKTEYSDRLDRRGKLYPKRRHASDPAAHKRQSTLP